MGTNFKADTALRAYLIKVGEALTEYLTQASKPSSREIEDAFEAGYRAGCEESK